MNLLRLILVATFPALAVAEEDPHLYGAWTFTFIETDYETGIDLEIEMTITFHAGGRLGWTTTADYRRPFWEFMAGMMVLDASDDAFDDLGGVPPLLAVLDQTGTYDIVDGAIHADVTEVEVFLNDKSFEEGLREFALALIPWLAEQLEVSEEDYPAFEAELLAELDTAPVTDELMGGLTQDLIGPFILADSYIVDGDTMTMIGDGETLDLTRVESDVGTAVASSTWGRLKATVR